MEKSLALEKTTVWKKEEAITWAILTVTAFTIPFLLGHPQLLVGSIVNGALFYSAFKLKGNAKILPIILLPSFAVLTRGLVFGPFTMFLVYMVPFIWIGNAILIYTARYFKKYNTLLAIALATALKAGFLYSIAMILIKAGVLPKVFAISMGAIQVYTALIGGVAAFTVYKLLSLRK